jgi:hypothetical protein
MEEIQMDILLIKIFFGHFVGDFFFQHRLMADNKYVSGRNGFLWCTFHVVVYTLTVAAFAGEFSLLFLAGVSIPHWIADRWSIAYQWMCVIGRGDLIGNPDPTRAAFGAIIYVVIDQTFHLGCLYLLVCVLK